MLNGFKKAKLDWKLGFFILAIAVGVFLRVYHFSDWLYFKLDQARDAFIISNAYFNGIGELPLLGPRAGGTFLLLGPAYYYFQYLTLLITRNFYPTTYALPDLFFSILSIPLFYLYLKKYFNRNWSLALASAYAICFFAIEYSRFAWNPNPLPFFTILYFYSVLNVLDSKANHPWLWLMASAFSLAVATQLHFLAFLALPAVTVIFLLFVRKDIKKFLNLKKILLFAGIIVATYLPGMLNDLLNNWKNIRLFWKAILVKLFSATLLEDIVMGMANVAQNWLIVLTGYMAGNKEILAASLLWLFFILPAIFAGIKFYKKEKDFIKKSFILLSLLWLLVFLVIDIPIGHQLWPRFFMGTLVVPFIFLGFYLAYFGEWFGNFKNKLFAVVLAVVIAGNLIGTYLWFGEIKAAESSKTSNSRTFVFKKEDGVVLWHINKLAEYMQKKCPNGNIYFTAASIYVKPIAYMLRYNQGYLEKNIFTDKNEKRCYFGVVGIPNSGVVNPDNFAKENFVVDDSQQFGEIRILEFSSDDDKILDLPRNFHSVSDEVIEGKADRLYWKDVHF